MKLFLSDFDGTLVKKDVLDVLCGLTGNEELSEKMNLEFIAGKREGLPTLKQRIDFLKGVTLKQIFEKLDENNFLIDGAYELFRELKKRQVTIVLHSGNLVPVLQYYQKELGIDYVIGNKPRMDEDTILGIELEDFAGSDFKVKGCQNIIGELSVEKKDIVAIGDSPSDLAVFGLAGKKIVINAKAGIEKHADIVLEKSLTELIPYLDDIIG